jgi:hypothetical protein
MIAQADALMSIFEFKRVKTRKCSYCREQFQPFRMGQKACSVECACQLAREKREKEERKADKVKRDKLKSRSDWLKEAQQAFNRWIRLRDDKDPCISCGRHHEGQYHAGHYLSTGARPELRFDPMNVHKQCQPCNTHLHGNLLMYRKAMIEIYGDEEVEILEGPHEPKKYSIEELKAIKDEYTKRAKEHGRT